MVRVKSLFACWSFVVVNVCCAFGQDSKPSLGERVHEFTATEVSRYAIRFADGSEDFKRSPRSLLRWSNAVRNRTFGDTYIWTHKGCAKAIVSLFVIVDRRIVSAECQSLSSRPLEMKRDGEAVWTPKVAGVEWKKLAGVPAPTEKPFQRLVQLNAIARQFKADFAPHTAPEEFTQLRLLPKPLYRYESEDPEVIDGAVYGFVDSTDPEVLLLIEAREQDGKRSWVYSPARSRHDHLRVYQKNKIDWEVPQLAPPWTNIRDPNKTYFGFQLKNYVESDDLDALIV